MRIFPIQLIATVLAGLALMGGSPLIAEPPAGWKLVFDDEFDGDSFDESKWSTTMEFIGTHGQRYHNEFYLSYTCDEEVVVRDGMLRLRTDRRTVEAAEAPTMFDYTQGLLSSHDKFSFTHGYVEIRAKYPGGKGLWPCLWLMPQHQGWPPEFDIAEYYAGQRTMHHGLAHGELYDSRWDSLWDKNSDFESDFHVIGLEWMPGRAVWSVDGVVRKTISADYVPNVPMYVILSNSVSSIHGPSGLPDEKTVFPNEFLIDYVRIYQAPAAEAPAIVTAPTAPVIPVAAILPTP
ncbi:MAG: glycoside hydrolase family 16 protein [Chthoniobacteraceae bacterium]